MDWQSHPGEGGGEVEILIVASFYKNIDLAQAWLATCLYADMSYTLRKNPCFAALIFNQLVFC